MIAFISLCYASLYLLIFNKLKLLQKTTANISAFVGVEIVLIATIVFVWYTYAPMSQDARVFRYVIPIVPNVKGEPTEVSVQNRPCPLHPQGRRIDGECSPTGCRTRAGTDQTRSRQTPVANPGGGPSRRKLLDGKPVHIISKVVMRMNAWLGYLTSP